MSKGQSPCECTEARSAASQEKRKGKALAKGRFFMDINSISSYYQDIYGNASNQISDQLKNKLQTDYSKATDDELMNVCKQFESYFMEQMLKEMVKTIPVNEERTGANATMTDYYKDMMIQNVASQSTEQNSLGLAQTLYEQMRRNYGLDEPNLPSK
jgi:flagellar protein FlgJ